VVYQTARTDLLELETRGYLRREMHGKAFVFKPIPDLQGMIRSDGADEDLRAPRDAEPPSPPSPEPMSMFAGE
jgi:hypothetical protein